jgi:hypothetical protein
MIPQIGVTLEEEGKIKSGGSDYFKIFGKLSLQDYEKMKVNLKINLFIIDILFKVILFFIVRVAILIKYNRV